MADKAAVVHLGENSPEHVAYELMQHVARVERMVLYVSQERADTTATRQWILDTYAECLEAVKGDRPYSRQAR